MAADYSSDTFKSKLGEDQPVLVDFYSDSCGPCKRLAPVIEELANDYEGKANVGKINIGDNMDLAVEYGISVVPTILLFKGGEVVERMQGYQDKSKLQQVLDSHAS